MFKLVAAAALLTVVSASCDWPSRFWCDSKIIARQCGVEFQCAEQFWVEESKARPVMLDLYFESLCAGCRHFITTMLYSTWKKFVGTNIMELRFFPYGNAEEVKDPITGEWNYTCQHGVDECTVNLIENCIQEYTSFDVMRYFPIFYCIESADQPLQAAKRCVKKGGLDWSAIHKCASGPEGNALMHKAALATEKLDPPHQYVPWIVVNGQHTETLQNEAQDDLPKLLCDTYKGPKPAQCKNQASEVNSIHACYRDY